MTLPHEVDVWLDERAGGAVRVGLLRPSFQGGRTLASTSFQYDPDYLTRADAYALSPDLPLLSSRQFAPESQVLFGAFSDAAPDEWGRKIIEANHAHRLASDPELPKSIGAYDFLLGVADRTRSGALRLQDRSTSEWLSDDPGVAELHDLSRILAAAGRYEDDEATDADLAYLNDVATSPGGARPKATIVTDDGRLAIAKLPHSKDGNVNVEAWEAVALTLAERCGIRTPDWELIPASPGKSVLLTHRFDRDENEGRLGYISAATALEIGEHDNRRVTYEHFADAIASLSARPREDLQEMFTRIALTLLINNVDDHWRNHGFLHDEAGWRLSPAFDLNPSPRQGSLSSRPISDDDDPRSRDIRNLVAVASSFQLDPARGGAIIAAVAREAETWPDVASRLGIAIGEHETMKRAFDPGRIELAKSLG